MFQNKEKIFGIGTRPKSLGGVTFLIQLDIIPIRSEVRSSLLQVNEKEELYETSHYIGPTGTAMLVELCEDQGRLIRKQDVQINELENQLADYEQELYEAWKRYLNIEQPSCLEEMA
jgi:hypothetical protein